MLTQRKQTEKPRTWEEASSGLAWPSQEDEFELTAQNVSGKCSIPNRATSGNRYCEGLPAFPTGQLQHSRRQHSTKVNICSSAKQQKLLYLDQKKHGLPDPGTNYTGGQRDCYTSVDIPATSVIPLHWNACPGSSIHLVALQKPKVGQLGQRAGLPERAKSMAGGG